MKKTISGIIGTCSLLLLVACGSESEPAPEATVSSAAESSATVEESADSEGGAPLPRTYDQACADVLMFLDGYEKALEESGDNSDTTREDMAAELLTSLEAYPEWSTMSQEEQSEVTRGINAAAAGSC